MAKPFVPFRQCSCAAIALLPVFALLAGCASMGRVMAPYSEKFSCKNDDHGQCIHPDKAYEDAVAGSPSRSDPNVTRDRKMLRGLPLTGTAGATGTGAFPLYRDSVYRELQGLIEAPVTPMLKPPRSVRTLILPYADRERPDRLYMPRFVYSLVDAPQWVVGDYLAKPVSPAAKLPVLEQIREKPGDIAPTPSPSTEPKP